MKLLSSCWASAQHQCILFSSLAPNIYPNKERLKKKKKEEKRKELEKLLSGLVFKKPSLQLEVIA